MSESKVDTRYILSPELKIIKNSALNLIQNNEKYSVADCMLITGESGSGKSALARNIAKAFPPYTDKTGTKIPVLHYEVKMVNSYKDLLTGLLLSINDPQMAQRGNATELLNRFIILTKTVKTKLIIIDEVQVIIERRNAKVISGVADLFKDLIKETNIPIIFMGMPWSKYLIESNPQLDGRIAIRHSMPNYRISHPKSLEKFKAFFHYFSKNHNFPDSLNDPNKEILFRLFAYSKGNVRQLTRLVHRTYISSITNESPIDLNLIAEVIRNQGIQDSLNPFKQKISSLILEENITESDFHFGRRMSKENAIIAPDTMRFKVNKDLEIYPLD